MYSRLTRTFAAELRQISSKIKSEQKFLSASLFNSLRNQSVKIKTQKQLKFYHQTASFSTGKKWNPYYTRKSTVDRIFEVQGNKFCLDCSSSDVRHLSTVNGGIYCSVCASIHKELGTHSDFLSLNDDTRINNDDMQFYESMGNNCVNNVYEAALDVVGTNKPTVSSSRSEITDFIKKKYLECSFSISRHDRSATENVLYFVSDMKAKGNKVPDLREKTTEKFGSTFGEMMDEAFDSPYVLYAAE